MNFIASVDEIMFCSGWDSKHVASADIMCFASYFGPSRAFNKNEDLVTTFVDLAANVLARRNAHQDHLGMFVCEQDFPEVVVL